MQALLDLGEDLIPGAARELSRDLYGLLVYAWAARADRTEAFHAQEVLRWVRVRAWRGYTDMPGLLAERRGVLPRGGTGARMTAFFKELAVKRSTCLFLPVVSRINCYQGKEGALPPGRLKVDGLADRHGNKPYARIVRRMFAGGPEIARDRDVFLLAVLVAIWGEGSWKAEGVELLALVRTRLRGLYDDPALALSAVRADRVSGAPHAASASQIVTAAEEIAVRAPWLWLEVLFVIENALAGPQWFEHAFEVKIIPSDDLP